MLLKVISGGQVGADQGGLAAAHGLHITTGGWAPKRFRTLYGSNIALGLLGLVEHPMWQYSCRTDCNVRDSNATIRLAYDFSTPGEVCTLNAIKKHDKPYRDIQLDNLPLCFDIVDFILINNIEILNIAGNAGRTKEESTKIFIIVKNYLTAVFRGCITNNGAIEGNLDV